MELPKCSVCNSVGIDDAHPSRGAVEVRECIEECGVIGSVNTGLDDYKMFEAHVVHESGCIGGGSCFRSVVPIGVEGESCGVDYMHVGVPIMVKNGGKSQGVG